MGNLKVSVYVNDGSEKAFDDFIKVFGIKVAKELSEGFTKAKGAYVIEGTFNPGDNVDLGEVIRQEISKSKLEKAEQTYNKGYLLCVKLDSPDSLKDCIVNFPGDFQGVYVYDKDYLTAPENTRDKNNKPQIDSEDGIIWEGVKLLPNKDLKIIAGRDITLEPNKKLKMQAGGNITLPDDVHIYIENPKFMLGKNVTFVASTENTVSSDSKQVNWDIKEENLGSSEARYIGTNSKEDHMHLPSFDKKTHYRQDYSNMNPGTTTVVVAEKSYYVTTWKNNGKTSEIKIFTLGEDSIYKGGGQYQLDISNERKVFVTTDQSKPGQELKVYSIVYAVDMKGATSVNLRKAYLPDGIKEVPLPENCTLLYLFKPNGDRVAGAFKRGMIDMSENQEINKLFGVSK